jgi:hypothetical protein
MRRIINALFPWTITARWSFVRVITLASFAIVMLDNAAAQEPGPLPTPIPEAELSGVDASAPLPEAEGAPARTNGDQPITETGNAIAETPRRFHYALSVVVREVYDDDINISPVNRIGDFYTSFEPTIRFSLGDIEGEGYNYLRVVYAPSYVLYADHSNADALQQVFHLEGQRNFGKLSATLSQDIQILNGTDLRSLTDTTGRQANIDAGRRTRENVYTTKIAASYDLSSKTFLSGGADYSRSDYQSLISSQTISGNLFLNYNYSPKLVIGLGTTGGYDETDSSVPSQYFEQVNLRVSYHPSEKLSFAATGGFEFRESDTGSQGTHTPVFDLSASYQPFDGTRISVQGSRHTENSAVIAGGDYTSTTIGLSLQQRFFQRFFISLQGGFQNAEYFTLLNGVDANRSDDYYYFQAGLDTSITRFWNIGVYYLHREDSSSLASNSFSDNQIGFRTSLTF